MMVATARNGPGKVCMGLTKLELEAYRVTPLPEVVSGNRFPLILNPPLILKLPPPGILPFRAHN